jgi:hypothetical protein
MFDEQGRLRIRLDRLGKMPTICFLKNARLIISQRITPNELIDTL